MARVTFRRGGRELGERLVSPANAGQSLLEVLEASGATAGLSDFEVYVRPANGDGEVQVPEARRQESLEAVLRRAAPEGAEAGSGHFIIDVTVPHVGAEGRP